MRVEIVLPDHRFNIGDIVRMDNERNDKSIYFRVTNFEYEGTWSVDGVEGVLVQQRFKGAIPTHESPYAAYYHGTLEPNSWTDSVEPAPLEGWMVFDVVELDTKGALV